MKLQSAEQLTLGQQVVQQLEGDCSQRRAQPAGMLLGGGRSLLLFLHLVNWGTSQASCWPCSAFKLSSKCVNHKMLMLGSTCKPVLEFVSRESASGKLKSPFRTSVPCHSIPMLWHLTSEASCLSGPCIWRALKRLNAFAGNGKNGLDALSSNIPEQCLLGAAAFFGKINGTIFPSVITLAYF